MTHDKFCENQGNYNLSLTPCICNWLLAVRQDEREQVAQRIEALNWDFTAKQVVYPSVAMPLVRDRCAEIARSQNDPSNN